MPLSDLAVLLGPNDSGKTSVLKLLRRRLDPPAGAPAAQRWLAEPTAFFARATRAERLILASEGFRRERELSHGILHPEDPLPLLDDLAELAETNELDDEQLWSALIAAAAVRRPDRDEPEGDPLAALFPDGASRALARELIDQYGLVAVEPHRHVDDEGMEYRYWVCLPPHAECPEAIKQALRGTRHHPLFDGTNTDSPIVEFLHPEAPVPVFVLGRTTIPLLPETIEIPAPFDAIERQLEAAIPRLGSELREWWSEGEDNPTGEDAWIEEDRGAVSVHPLIEGICATVSEAVTERLPYFVSERYSFTVTPLAPHRWRAGRRARMELVPLTDPRAAFQLDAVAAGFRVWLQLAMFQVLGAIEDQLAAVMYLNDYEPADFDDELADEHPLRVAEAGLGSSPDAAPSLTETGLAPLAAVHEWLRRRVLTLTPSGRARALAVLRARLFLIDEPEQHLHERLMPGAARWLERAMSAPRLGALITTHHPAILDLSGRTNFVYLVRGRDGVAFRPFTPSDLEAADLMAREMGYDRGALLTRTAAILYVEGAMDRAVIETLIADELRRSGIAVSVFGGVGNIENLLHVPLLRYTSAPAFVLVDGVPLRDARRIATDAEFRNSQLSQPDQERRALARLVRAAATLEKHVEPLGLGAPDVFDILDDECLRDIDARWPGHAKARAAYAEYRTRARSARARTTTWKSFYEHRFGVPVTVDTCRRTAQLMAVDGRVPTHLRIIVTTIVEHTASRA